MQVLVRDNNVDQALRALKKKMQREGIFREMKLRGHYEKPSEKKAREKAEAVRRARKLIRKRMQREGLLPSKPPPGDPLSSSEHALISRLAYRVVNQRPSREAGRCLHVWGLSLRTDRSEAFCVGNAFLMPCFTAVKDFPPECRFLGT